MKKKVAYLKIEDAKVDKTTSEMIMGYRRSRERNRRLKKLYNKTKTSYGAGAYYDECKGRYIKYCPKKPGAAKYLRKVSNKKVRKYKGYLKQGASYRKVDEYQWKLY